MISICLMVVDAGNDELPPQDLNALDRAVTCAGEASGSSDECEDEVMKILCLLFLEDED